MASVLQTNNLVKEYKLTKAVDQVNLHIEQGQIYGLVGQNGAGKTTLIRMITGQTSPTSGGLALFGKMDEGEMRQMRKRLGAIVEAPSFYPFLTAAENLEYYRTLKGVVGKEKVQEALATVGLAAPDKEFEKLLLQVNALIEYTGQAKVDAEQKEIALRDEFARATHDLRTPLTSILGYLQLAQKEETEEAAKAEYMRIAYERAQNLQMRIDGLYEITKLEAQNETELARVNLRNILLDLTAAYYFDFNEENRAIQLNMPEHLTDIYAEEEAVKRIFDNLYKNAFLHGIGNVQVNVTESAEHIAIEISNKTTGLKNEDMSHLFERFYTADVSRSKGNSGLGLSIVRALVLQMGGEVEALLQYDVFIMRLVLPKAKPWQ